MGGWVLGGGGVKTRYGRLVVMSSVVGAGLLKGASILARWLLAPQEVPVGVLTAVLGGGYLLWLMHRRAEHEIAP